MKIIPHAEAESLGSGDTREEPINSLPGLSAFATNGPQRRLDYRINRFLLRR